MHPSHLFKSSMIGALIGNLYFICGETDRYPSHVKYVRPPGVKNYTYFSLVDKRLASYHQSLLARGPRVRINLENIFNKLSMALSCLVLSALSDLEKHPDITAFITQDHLWPKIVLESQNSVSLGIEFRTMMSNSIKKVCVLSWCGNV